MQQKKMIRKFIVRPLDVFKLPICAGGIALKYDSTVFILCQSSYFIRFFMVASASKSFIYSQIHLFVIIILQK
jgi:hypothetical protein